MRLRKITVSALLLVLCVTASAAEFFWSAILTMVALETTTTFPATIGLPVPSAMRALVMTSVGPAADPSRIGSCGFPLVQLASAFLRSEPTFSLGRNSHAVTQYKRRRSSLAWVVQTNIPDLTRIPRGSIVAVAWAFPRPLRPS